MSCRTRFVFIKIKFNPQRYDNYMNNISSVDIATITVFKKELENLAALNQRLSPIVIEYLTQRIANIEHPPLNLSDSC